MPAASAPPPQQQQNFREKRKGDGDRTSYENKKQQLALKPPQNGGRQAAPNQRVEYRPKAPPCAIEYRPKAPPCAKCSKNYHGECRAGTDRCYNCGRSGHFSKECPNKNAGTGARQNYQGPHPQLRALQTYGGGGEGEGGGGDL